MKSLFSVYALVLLSLFAVVTPSAHASSITYTFTGSGLLSGTNFTYVTADGFLSFDTGVLIPTTSTDLFIGSYDGGAISGFDFIAPTAFKIFGTPYQNTFSIRGGDSGYQISALTLSENLVDGSTLSITNTPTTVTPEPSTFLLLGTGVVGMFRARRRIFKQ